MRFTQTVAVTSVLLPTPTNAASMTRDLAISSGSSATANATAGVLSSGTAFSYTLLNPGIGVTLAVALIAVYVDFGL